MNILPLKGPSLKTFCFTSHAGCELGAVFRPFGKTVNEVSEVASVRTSRNDCIGTSIACPSSISVRDLQIQAWEAEFLA